MPYLPIENPNDWLSYHLTLNDFGLPEQEQKWLAEFSSLSSRKSSRLSKGYVDKRQKIANTNDNYYQFVVCLILSDILTKRDECVNQISLLMVSR